MLLKDLIEQIDSQNDEFIVFAEKISNSFQGNSKIILLELSDEDLAKPIIDVASERTHGLEYFLEIFIIRELWKDWINVHIGQKPSTEQFLEAVIYYAENDAYLNS